MRRRALLDAGHGGHRAGRSLAALSPGWTRLHPRSLLIPSVHQTVGHRALFVLTGDLLAAGHGRAGHLPRQLSLPPSLILI